MKISAGTINAAPAGCTRLKIVCGVTVITFGGKAEPPMTDNPLWEICERVRTTAVLYNTSTP